MNSVRALQGVSVSVSNAVNFGMDTVVPAAAVAAAASDAIPGGADIHSSQHLGCCSAAMQSDQTLTVQAPDYSVVHFDPTAKTWNMN